MAELPFLPLATDAYLADTTHLTTEQHGAYLLLLMAAWRNPDCDLPDDDVQLAQICRMSLRSWRAKNAPVLAFFSLKSGRLKQKRLSDTREKVQVKRKQRLDALARANKAKKRSPSGAADAPADAPAYAAPNAGANQNQNQKSTGTGTRREGAREGDRAPEARHRRGTRLPDVWFPSEDDIQFAHQRGFDDSRIKEVADQFRDYWHSMPGQRGVKSRWDLTWRNWLRREAPTGAGPPSGKSSRMERNKSAMDGALEIIAEARSKQGELK